MCKRCGLSENERLKSKREIQELFSKGSSFFLYPYKIKFQPSEALTLPKILVSVSKKFFKKAVTRNRLKRQIKEAYRLSKCSYTEGIPIESIAFIYVGKEANADFEFLKKRMEKLLQGIITKSPE